MRPAELLSIAEKFTDAAFDGSCWMPALDALAQATGSARGQLIGIGGPTAFPFNLVTNLDSRAIDDLALIAGGSPSVNWRVAASLQRGAMTVVSERDYARAKESLPKNNPYDDFAAQYDIEYGCQSALIQEGGLIVGLALLRGRNDGPSTAEARRAMAELAPHVRQSVKTAMLLEQQGAQIVAGTLDAMSIAAFVCDDAGDVRAMTAAAEAMVSIDGPLKLRCSRLSGVSAGTLPGRKPGIRICLADDAAMDEAMFRTSTAGIPATLVIGMPHTPTIISVLALPKPNWSFRFAPGALVVVRTAKESGSIATDLLRSLYRLTQSEAEVASAFVAGHSRDRIAQERGVSLATIQSQMKGIFQKVGVNRETDLALKLAALSGL